MARLAFVCAVVAIAGCVTLDDDLTEVEQPVIEKCPTWQCGSNSPEIASRGFHELSELGLTNLEGFRIVNFKKNGVQHVLDVNDGKLYGRTTSGHVFLSAEAGNLVGARILVAHSSGAQYLIRIVATHTDVDFWAHLPGVVIQPKAESYQLEWILTYDGVNPAPFSRWKNVCSRASLATNPENLGMHGYHTVLFEGDRINSRFKTVGSVIDNSWFNLGCAGHALAKMHLTGHTDAAGSAGFATTISERRTILKMFAADYCGGGFPLTVAGQLLSWKDDSGWMDHTANVTIEARWTPTGASCLEVPRIEAHPTLASLDVFPDGVDDAAFTEAGCTRPPKCSELAPPNVDPDDFAGTHIVSGNP